MYDDVEIIQEASEKMGVDYIGNATIIDLKGLSLSRHMNLGAMSIFKEMILIHTYYYPEQVMLCILSISLLFSTTSGIVHVH